MAWLLRHNWLWTLLAFFLGAAITWFLVVRRSDGEAAGGAQTRDGQAGDEQARESAERRSPAHRSSGARERVRRKEPVLVGAGAASGRSDREPDPDLMDDGWDLAEGNDPAASAQDDHRPAGGDDHAAAARDDKPAEAAGDDRPETKDHVHLKAAGDEPEQASTEPPEAAGNESLEAEGNDRSQAEGDDRPDDGDEGRFSLRMESNGFATSTEDLPGPAGVPLTAPEPAPVDGVLAGPAGPVEVPPGRYGEGSADALPHQSPPDGFIIKGNTQAMVFHTPDSPSYGRTRPQVWFRTEADAERAGFTRFVRRPHPVQDPVD